MINAYWQDLRFQIPNDVRWKRVVDTSASSPQDLYDESASEQLPMVKDNHWVRGRSIIVLVGDLNTH